MENIFVKKCSAVQTDEITFFSCNTNYSFDGHPVFTYEDTLQQEPLILSRAHQAFKDKYHSLQQVPENATIEIGSYIFKTGAAYKRGLSTPQVTCIDYTIEEKTAN